MLSPYRVLDLSDDRGHFAGFILAMLGAEVIAVEPRGGTRARRVGPWLGGVAGPERSLTHLAYNRGKRSVELDYASDSADRAELLRLVAGADVLIDSAPAGYLAAVGLGPDDLAAHNPALVTCSVTAFGGDGPQADQFATDLTVRRCGSGCPRPFIAGPRRQRRPSSSPCRNGPVRGSASTSTPRHRPGCC